MSILGYCLCCWAWFCFGLGWSLACLLVGATIESWQPQVASDWRHPPRRRRRRRRKLRSLFPIRACELRNFAAHKHKLHADLASQTEREEWRRLLLLSASPTSSPSSSSSSLSSSRSCCVWRLAHISVHINERALLAAARAADGMGVHVVSHRHIATSLNLRQQQQQQRAATKEPRDGHNCALAASSAGTATTMART